MSLFGVTITAVVFLLKRIEIHLPSGCHQIICFSSPLSGLSLAKILVLSSNMVARFVFGFLGMIPNHLYDGILNVQSTRRWKQAWKNNKKQERLEKYSKKYIIALFKKKSIVG